MSGLRESNQADENKKQLVIAPANIYVRAVRPVRVHRVDKHVASGGVSVDPVDERDSLAPAPVSIATSSCL